MKIKMPKKIFVRWNTDGQEPFLELGETTEGFNHNDKVGIFELKEIKTLVIKSELVS